jgi:Ca2+-binding EF-hand superfamily protein
MRKDLTIMLAAALLAGGAGVSVAAEGDRPMRGEERRAEMFGRLDADGDARVTRAEMEAHRTARFAAADADGDGRLTADELSAAAPERAGGFHGDRATRMIRRFDTDGDGALSAKEWADRPGPARMFDRLDADADGGISAQEFAEARPMSAERHARDGQGPRREMGREAWRDGYRDGYRDGFRDGMRMDRPRDRD